MAKTGVNPKLKGIKKKNHTKRRKHCLWSEAAMMSAMQAVQQRGMSQRAARHTLTAPRCSLQVRLYLEKHININICSIGLK